MASKKRIVWLDGANDEQSLIGSKAANLVRLRKAGLPVPDGFCITIDAVAELFSDNYEGITESFSEFLLPADIQYEILEAYRILLARSGKDVKVAVRSSALSEDLVRASFAGQYESYLNCSMYCSSHKFDAVIFSIH